MSDNGRNELDMTPEGRVAYLEALMARDEPWADLGPVFVEFLDDEDPEVRAAAVRGLWSSSDASLVDRLLEMATYDSSAMVRARAISGLGIYIHEGMMLTFDEDEEPFAEFLGDDEITEAQFNQVRDYLFAVYEDEDRTTDERRYAVESLAFLFEPEVADLIKDAYNSPEKEMKVSAVFAMGRNGLARWNDILARELYSADPDLQREAIRAVGELGPPELGKDLLRLTYAEDPEIKFEAIEALGQSGWEGAFERLEELTLDLNPQVADMAEIALEEWLMWREVLEGADDLDADEDPSWDDG